LKARCQRSCRLRTKCEWVHREQTGVSFCLNGEGPTLRPNLSPNWESGWGWSVCKEEEDKWDLSLFVHHL
jgi:hypothetical protein